MRVFPVLDLLHGQVVQGVAGRRERYQPIMSQLAPGTSEPLAIAEAFRTHLGLSHLYLADLDAILHGQPNLEIFQKLEAAGFNCWIDAGLRTDEDADRIFSSCSASLISGLETIAGPEMLTALCQRWGSERVIFSLDLLRGRPLGTLDTWNLSSGETSQQKRLLQIVSKVLQRGIEQLIILDLAQVGVSRGVSTGPLCQQVLQEFPNLKLITGGGVRGPQDLAHLQELGISGVLVSSALHDGRLTRSDLAACDVASERAAG